MPNWLNEFLTYAGTPEGERAIKVILAILGVVGAVLLWSFGVIQKIRAALFGAKKDSARPQPTQQVRDNAHGGFAEASSGGAATAQVLGDQTINQGAPVGQVTLTIEQFMTITEKERVTTEAKLRDAQDNDKSQLRDKITELERQLADPDAALADAENKITDLTDRLERVGNEVGGDRLNEAREALQRLDFSVADDIFAEIEARQELAVQDAARAAFGRGEVAEAEVRWRDAAAHYARAARLEPEFGTLRKASEFAQRSGDYSAAVSHSAALVAFCEAEGTQELLANAINEHALNTSARGDLPEAERLFRQALKIDKATIGEAHPDYAIRLNNLALVLQARGDLAEAERLLRQALEIGKTTIGEAHPDYANRLTNLALVLETRGDLAEAERLLRQALKIDKATIGEAHPDYATHAINLADLLADTDRRDEAGPLFEAGLRIREAVLGAEHPDTQTARVFLEEFREGG